LQYYAIRPTFQNASEIFKKTSLNLHTAAGNDIQYYTIVRPYAVTYASR